jgi:hypothetical protein
MVRDQILTARMVFLGNSYPRSDQTHHYAPTFPQILGIMLEGRSRRLGVEVPLCLQRSIRIHVEYFRLVRSQRLSVEC